MTRGTLGGLGAAPLVLLAHLACSGSGGAVAAAAAPAGDAVVATVAGEPIVVSELLLAARDASAADAQAIGGGSAASGEYPDDAPRRDALGRAAKIKLAQILMRQDGQLQDVSYRDFRARWTAENDRRREALRLGQPIYGPEQYGEPEYFAYQIATGLTALRQRFPVTSSETELRAEYDAVKDREFHRGRRRKLRIVQLVHGPDQDAATRRARAAIERIRGEAPRDPAVAAAGKPPGAPTVNEMILDEARLGRGTGGGDPIQRAALRLNAHETSEILDTGSTFALVTCLAIEDLGYVPFPEARLQLESRHRERAFEAHLQDLVLHANVQIRPDVYPYVALR